MQAHEDQNWLNSLNVFQKISLLFLLVISVTSCSSSIPLFKADKQLEYKEYSITENNSFLPREYRQVLDSSFLADDYIDRKIKIHFPDTVPDSALYNPDAPTFDPYPNDSGIVLCERDMALYIKDRETVKYLKTELNARKQVHVEIIKGAIEAEELYRGTIIESNNYNKQVFEEYKNEKSKKETWRNIALFVMAFGTGFIVNEYVAHD